MEETHSGIFAWLQDNARILLSVILVLFLLFAVYSYSKRTDRSKVAISDANTELVTGEDGSISGEGEVLGLDETTSNIKKLMDGKDEVVAVDVDTDTTKTQEVPEKTVPAVEHREGSIRVTAARGEGMTHMARRATAEYLGQNNVSDLSLEHKVYIEDYLRKAMTRQNVYSGTQVDFSNDLIASAIQKAQALNDTQLSNLAKYVTGAPSLQ